MESGGPGPRGLLLQLAVAHNASGGPRTAAFLSGSLARICREADPVELAMVWTRLFVSPRAAPCRPWHDTWQSNGPRDLVARNTPQAKVPSLKATGELLRDAVAPVAG